MFVYLKLTVRSAPVPVVSRSLLLMDLVVTLLGFLVLLGVSEMVVFCQSHRTPVQQQSEVIISASSRWTLPTDLIILA